MSFVSFLNQDDHSLLIASESMSHSVMLHKIIKKQNDLNTSVLVYVQNISFEMSSDYYYDELCFKALFN